MRFRKDVCVVSVAAALAAMATAMAGCTGEPIKLAWAFTSTSPIYSTPLVTKDMIVFGDENGVVTALDKNGQFRWRFSTSMNVISSPRALGDKIFFGSINYAFYAIDKQGRELWKYPTRKPIKSDAAIYDGVVYFASYDGHIYAVKPDDRSTVWIFPPKPVAATVAEEGEPPPAPVEPQLQVGEFSYSSPAISDGVIYIGNIDGFVYAVDAKSGKLKWRYKTGDAVTSSPAVEGGVVYVGSNDNNIYALDTKTGNKIWSFKTGAWVNGSPRVGDGVVYCGSNDKNLYALDAKTGALKGQFTAEGPIISTPSLYKNLIIIGGGQGDGNVYCLDRATLKQLYKYKTAAKIESDPVVDGDMVYVTSFDRQLYAFKFKVK
ncbi:MAG: PQQ-binding-like beta-propeller repeat protein [Myxococcota bacterium]|jgi:outer membrane protein assembly factor BamB